MSLKLAAFGSGPKNPYQKYHFSFHYIKLS